MHPIRSLVLMVTMLASAAPASASSLRSIPLPELVQRSQKIVRGVVSDVQSRTAPDGSIWTRYTLDRAHAAKGRLTASRKFHFRCRGGSTDAGTDHVPGTPQFAVGEEVVVFYAPDNRTCQVMGWLQGSFRVVRSPRGRAVVVDHHGRLLVGVNASGFVRGPRPSWVRMPQQVDSPETDAATATDSTAEDTSATAEEVMQELGTLSRSLLDLAPVDQPSEGAGEFFPPMVSETALPPNGRAQAAP